MLQAPTATARARRGDEPVVGRTSARRRLVRSPARPPLLYLRDMVDLPGRPARPRRPRTGDPSPATRGRDRVAKAHAAHATLSAELGRDTGAGELAGRLG